MEIVSILDFFCLYVENVIVLLGIFSASVWKQWWFSKVLIFYLCVETVMVLKGTFSTSVWKQWRFWRVLIFYFCVETAMILTGTIFLAVMVWRVPFLILRARYIDLTELCITARIAEQKNILILVLLSPNIPCLCKQWSGSALFAIKYVNLNEQSGSSNLTGWKLEVGTAC